MTKNIVKAHLDDNLSAFPLVCGFIISGPLRVRQMKFRIHKKKCKQCSTIRLDLQDEINTIREGKVIVNNSDIIKNKTDVIVKKMK